MNSVASINIALEILAFVFLAIIMSSMLFDKNRMLPLNRSFIRLLWFYLIVLLFDSLCWSFDGNPDPQIFYVVFISNFFVYAFSILGAAAYNDYIITFISTRTTISKKPVYIVTGICWAQVFLVIVSQFNHMFYYIDEANRYCRGDLYYVPYIVPIVISMIQIAVILRHRKILGAGDTFALLSYNILLFTGVILQSILNLIMLLYVCVSVGLFIVYIRIQLEQAKRLEAELTNSRIDIMLSQIQPHFLYNTLATIEAFCNKDGSKTSAKMVRDFSNYLRENMDALTQKELVSFHRELEHIRIYLDIEKMRFEDRLTVVYDLQATDFRLPILTLQPLVENAVRYGVSKKRFGGTVTLSTCLVPEGVKITVADNGSGFDPAPSKTSGGRSHIGIENVRERLRTQCGGILTIESEEGKGTVCTVMIPQGADKL